MPKRTFGTHEIARLCQVTPPTIGRWIEEGKMPSFKTAGGHRRVWDVDLAVFLRAHNIPVPAGLALVPRVLVVDDEADVRRFILRTLAAQFAAVETHEASDGFEAGHKIATLHPALVVLDLRLPGADGFKVCRTVRADPAFQDVRILAISGAGGEASRRQILAAGADAFLPKPFDSDELVVRLKEMLPSMVPRGKA